MESGSPLMLSQRITDPERLVEGIRGADLLPCQLSRTPHVSELGRIVLPSLCLDFVKLGPAMLFTGITPRDCYTLCFILECPDFGCAFNFDTTHTDGYLGFFAPGGILDATTPEGYRNVTLTVPVPYFLEAIALHFPEIPAKMLLCGAAMRIGSEAQWIIRRLVLDLKSASAEGATGPGAAAAIHHLEADLIFVFLRVLRSGMDQLVPPPPRRFMNREKSFRKTRDYLHAHRDRPLHLAEICAVTGLSDRGVENLFRHFLGVGPITYLRHLRLHAVRRTLSLADPSPGFVKETALSHGFWHFGNFSRYYRTLFGETPSLTMARTRISQ